VTFVRRENAHPAHVHHVSWGRDQPKQTTRGKNMSPSSGHRQSRGLKLSDQDLAKETVPQGCAGQPDRKGFAFSSTVENRWS